MISRKTCFIHLGNGEGVGLYELELDYLQLYIYNSIFTICKTKHFDNSLLVTICSSE